MKNEIKSDWNFPSLTAYSKQANKKGVFMTIGKD